MTTPTAEQSAYLNTLEDVASMLTKSQGNIKKCPKQRLTVGYVKTRLKTIENYWNDFKQAHEKLIKCTPREQRGLMPYFLREEYFTYEELYINLQSDLTDLLLSLERPTPRNEDHSSVSNLSPEGQLSFARLPRIQLPTFSGRYEDWPTYQDLFTALVHNTSISNVQKLHYLKTSISGEAEMLLRHIQITEDNYTQAWELLKGRFGSKKMIVNSVMKKIFNQKKVNNPTPGQIKSLVDTTTECIHSLNNLKICTDSWDPIIIFLVGQKLDSESLKDWEEHASKNTSEEMPTWSEMKQFLETKFRTLELILSLSTSSSRDKPQAHKSFHASTNESEEHLQVSAHASFKSQPLCTYCKGEHYNFNCKEFGKLTLAQRHDHVRQNRLCYNCLIPNHNVYNCKQRKTCRICRRRHHSLLHEDRTTKQEGERSEESEVNNENNIQLQIQPEHKITTAHISREQLGHEVLLATAQVEVKSSDGQTYLLRALIDQGSEASFVSSRVVDLLALKRIHISGEVSGIGGENHNKIPIKYLVDMSVMSRFHSNAPILVKAYVLKTISTRVPSKQVVMKETQLQTINLADTNYHIPGNIDILLGADVYGKIIEDGLIKMSDGIIAQKTIFGWILSGQREDTIKNNHTLITLHVTSMVAEDNDLLRKFWEIETELYKKQKWLTKDEEKCEQIYKATTKRDDTGRYIVHLPLKQSVQETIMMCGDTKEQAIKRFQNLEKKFQNCPSFKSNYTKVIHEYKEMGHMKLSDESEDNKAIYLPHHAVVREDKETSKLRVVFDASAKGSKGHSLNDTMLVGPVLQPDLRSLIVKWRTYEICVVGDIVKMYRMIRMTKEHTNLQRIVWRDNPADRLESYDLTTVTFGTAAAPYLAVRTLNQLADDEARSYPDTAPVIKQSFFMDDLMLGNNEGIEETKRMCDEINEILKKGGFQMQKWSSNSEEVLQHLQEENYTEEKMEIKLNKVIKILGLTWDRKEDVFVITVNLPEMTYPITKRSVLSDVARLFDPFGWMSPVVIRAKVLIQKLWLLSLGWDDELPLDICEEWINFRNDLTHLQNIKIPRWLKSNNNKNKDVKLHGFADASTQAYAAVTYLRVVEDDGTIHVTLIASRTKVAPLKQLSVPKLELCAAALLAELVSDLQDIINIPQTNVHVWTDSMVVLSWLQSQPNRWRTFVANRVADITRVLDNERWRHVQSVENPADVATRGVKADDLASQKLWWNGPDWLQQENLKYDRNDIPQTALELKISLHSTVEVPPIWERFSTLSRMKRILAFCRRWYTKRESKIEETYVTTKEMEEILEMCIKYYQEVVYGREIDEIKNKNRVSKRSSLITLSPFLDKNELLRVGGRLNNSSIANTTKNPIIIPDKQHITRLIIQEAHTRTLHGGVQLMMAYIRTNYWVIGLKSAVKKCIRLCKTCVVDKARVRHQLMGQLPAVRVNPHRPFINSGVDYAGPVMIRTSKGRGHHATKGYICLFVCMSTHAIHLEAVTDLTSQAFLAAFRRFVARRGHCLHVWSDNGTNFVGAAKELKFLFRTNTNNTHEVAEVLANEGTTWHFIPPRMPSYGGLWEAGVKSVKRHLNRVTKDTKLTYEEMVTLLAQIEACLNSRPLCQIDNSIETPLTPGHFLVGESLISVPDLNYEDKKIGLLSRWQVIQKMTQDFWRQWQREYLHTLQQRHKWQVTVKSPSVGDLVVIKDEMTPPTKWLLGRIKCLHPGADHLVRVVTVRCKGNHELKRPLSKLILLPKDDK